MKKLNPKVKKTWVEALRSKEYVQTDAVLCKRGKKYDKFCCLGVLTDLAVRSEVPGVYWMGDDEGYLMHTSGKTVYDEDPECYTSRETNRWAGLSTDAMKKCTTWNDEDHLTFDEIADKIQEEL